MLFSTYNETSYLKCFCSLCSCKFIVSSNEYHVFYWHFKEDPSKVLSGYMQFSVSVHIHACVFSRNKDFWVFNFKLKSEVYTHAAKYNIPNLQGPDNSSESIKHGRTWSFKSKKFLRCFQREPVLFPSVGLTFLESLLSKNHGVPYPCLDPPKWCEGLLRRGVLWILSHR